MIEKSVVQKEFFDFMADHDTSWVALGKLEPLAVCQIYYMLGEIMQAMKLSAAEGKPLDVSGNSEFLQAVNGKDSVAVWSIMDDLMDTLHATAPRVYDRILRRVKEVDTAADR